MFNQTVPTLMRCTKATKDREANKPAPRAPSQRDQEIFKRVVVGGERQAAVATELNLTKGRVSQIVSRVRRWIAEGSPGDPELLSWRQRQRLERSLALARQQAIYDEAMRELARQQASPKQRTVRTETKDGEETKVVTTVRDVPLNMQLLKTAQRAAEVLERLSQREPLPEEPPKMPSEIELHEHVTYALRELRRLAEEAGRVTTGIQSEAVIVDHVLHALLGEDSYGLPHEPAAREIVERLLTGRSSVGGELPGERSAGGGQKDRGQKEGGQQFEDQTHRRADREAAIREALNRAKPAAAEKQTVTMPDQPSAASIKTDSDIVSSEDARQKPNGQQPETSVEKTKRLAPAGGVHARRRLAIEQPPHRRQDRQARRKLLQESPLPLLANARPVAPAAEPVGLAVV